MALCQLSYEGIRTFPLLFYLLNASEGARTLNLALKKAVVSLRETQALPIELRRRQEPLSGDDPETSCLRNMRSTN